MHVTDCCHMPEHFRGRRHLSELQQYQSAVGADAQGNRQDRPTRLQMNLHPILTWLLTQEPSHG